MIHSDADLLSTFEQKLQIIRDRVRGVAEHFHTGLYITGRPGTSKTFTVKEELERADAPYKVKNARMTPMGLYDFLEQNPEHVVVLDDIGSLFDSRIALQILMAALDGDPGKPRLVQYKSKDKDSFFYFTGGIIAISNLPLRKDPLGQAVSSRTVGLEHEPTDEELAAFMRKLAEKEYKGLSSLQCRDVVDFVVEESRTGHSRLDLRHLTKALEDRRQWENGLAKTNWTELVRTSMQKLLCHRVPTKAEELEQQQRLVKEALARFPSDRDAQIKFTGLSKSTFYQRLRELTLMPSH